MNGKFFFSAALAGFSLLVAACSQGGSDKAADVGAKETAGEVNVYSGRHYDSDTELFSEFTKETGVKVNLIEAGGDALIERLVREAEASPADIFMTADAGILWRAEQRGVFRSITDEAILNRVPAQFRHPGGKWVGLSKRARILIYNKEAGLPEGLSTYGDLADPRYRNMICVRSSSNVYNQSLLAAMIAHLGADEAEQWTKGVVANFARKPQGNDTAQIEAVAAGICRIGIVNSYYVARFIGSADEKAADIGEKIAVLFPNQETSGTHINISGIGVTAHAPHPENALMLVEFLLRDSAQTKFALGNNEYPVVRNVAAKGPVALLGAFNADDLAVAALGEHQPEAVKMFDRAGWQ